MSHCGLCGAYINDPHDDWYICADCVGDIDVERGVPVHRMSLIDFIKRKYL